MSQPPYPTDRESLERDCEVEFYTGPGPGGQHRNRSRTAVRLTHLPSGQVVTASERRSQRQNLDAAYERLAERLAELNHVKKKRRPTRPSRASQRKRVEEKKKRADVKRRRGKPKVED